MYQRSQKSLSEASDEFLFDTNSLRKEMSTILDCLCGEYTQCVVKEDTPSKVSVMIPKGTSEINISVRRAR